MLPLSGNEVCFSTQPPTIKISDKCHVVTYFDDFHDGPRKSYVAVMLTLLKLFIAPSQVDHAVDAHAMRAPLPCSQWVVALVYRNICVTRTMTGQSFASWDEAEGRQ
jgi:hypothetical protein